MNPMNKTKAGFALGGLLGLMHACWALLILVGLAQPFMNWIFNLHMIVPPYTVAPFSWTAALTLIIVTFVIGYIVGWVFAWIWNRLHRV